MKNLLKIVAVGIDVYTKARVAAHETLVSAEMQEAVKGTVADVLVAYRDSGLKAAVQNFLETEEAVAMQAEVIAEHMKAELDEIVATHLNKEIKDVAYKA